MFGWRKRPEAEALARLKAWTREIFRLGPGDAVSANEIVCHDPACPGLETVILVMRTGQPTQVLKFPVTADAVTRDMLAESHRA